MSGRPSKQPSSEASLATVEAAIAAADRYNIGGVQIGNTQLVIADIVALLAELRQRREDGRRLDWLGDEVTELWTTQGQLHGIRDGAHLRQELDRQMEGKDA